jgi:hypothetical protein
MYIPKNIKVPWLDFFLFGGFFLFSAAVLIVTLLNDPTLTAIIVFSVSTAGFGVVFTFILVRWFKSLPDFCLTDGTLVWTDGINTITPGLMQRALDFYQRRLVKFIFTINEAKVREAIASLCIWWSKDLVSFHSKSYHLVDKEGLQLGKDIKVHWRGTVSSSALFHEIHHVVQEVVMLKYPDLEHNDREWWQIEQEISKIFIE